MSHLFREVETYCKINSTARADKKEARAVLSNEAKQLKDRETKRLQTAIKIGRIYSTYRSRNGSAYRED
jgi:hypothetical protein